MPGLFPAATTLQLQVFTASQASLPSQSMVDPPASLSMCLYDPSNIPLYSNSGPIAHPPADSTSAYWFEFTLPAYNLILSTADEANYTVMVTANLKSGRTVTRTTSIKLK